ncbi:hypothetical protein PsYK624_029800 [Phanerochaete sordida]|uniref:F-box domain-containing protein n=1 Tax=Phanerochaete sordida TaxID=48140 RepID=A0A9P3G2G9_9APHY|nr:hypothetical protein PsYK624_029800 [Phanerochaete sordida]
MSLRRSSRTKVQRDGSANAALSAAADPAPKVDAPKSMKARRVRGKLSGLTNMPLDVIIEVMMNLEPCDLLSLSRTTKTYRDFLMRKSSAFLWKAARSNVEGYPPCPEHMNEAALASFLYTTYCTRCLKPNTKRIQWDVLARYCKACVTDVGALIDTEATLATVLRRALPENTQAEHEYCHTDLWDILPYYDFSQPPWIAGCMWSDVDKLQQALTEQPEQYKEILEEREESMVRFRECRKVIKKWYYQKLEARKDDICAIRDNRYTNILERLRDAGWGTELRRVVNSTTALEAFKNLPCVKEPRPLTDRIWGNIQGTVVEWLETTREELIEEEHVRVTGERLKILDRALVAICPYRPGEPSRTDIALGIPEVREVVERPPQDPVDEDSFAFLHEALFPFRGQWRQDAEAYLETLVCTQLGEIPDNVKPLELAVAHPFLCKLCKRILSYPEMLSHTCCRHHFRYQNTDSESFYRREVFRAFTPYLTIKSGLIHWDPSAFGVSTDIDAMKIVVEMFGLDATRATKDEIAALPTRFVCKVCCEKGVLKAMNWTETYNHLNYREHNTPSYRGKLLTAVEYAEWQHSDPARQIPLGCYLVALPAALADAARTLEHAEDHSHDGALWWACARCSLNQRRGGRGVLEYNRGGVVQHLRDAHGIALADVDPKRDYYCSRSFGLRDGTNRVSLLAERFRDAPEDTLPLSAVIAIRDGAAVFVDMDEFEGEGQPVLETV